MARTKSRQEKALAWNPLSRGIEYFLPLVSRPQKQKGRMRTSIVPLFNGYLFFRGTHRQRYEALSTGRIAQVLEGVEGLVQKRKNNIRLIVKIEANSQAPAVEIDLDQIWAF